MENEPSYACIHFSLKYRPLLLIGAGIAPIIMILLLAWPSISLTMVVAGVLAGAGATFLMQLFIEIVAVIAETLLPR